MDTWNQSEEDAFLQLMTAGRITRLEAIRLFRRCRGGLDRALEIAKSEAPSAEEIARRAAFGESARLRASLRRQAVAA
jgi:hypothetical protein